MNDLEQLKQELMLEKAARQLAEQQLEDKVLEKANTLWRFALEGSGDGIWEYNVLSGECRYSTMYKNNLGYNDEEMPDHISEWRKRIHPDDLPIIEASDSAYKRGSQKSHSIQYRMQRRDKSYTWVLDRGMLMKRAADGTPIHFIGVHTNIDQIKKTEAELYTTVETLGLLVANLKDAVLLLDETCKILLVNATFSRMFGLDFLTYQLQGRNVSQLVGPLSTVLKYPEEILAKKMQILSAKQPVNEELVELANGRILALNYGPVFIKGKFNCHLLKFSDVTESRAAEIKLVQAEAKYRGIIEGMDIGLLESDTNRRILYANQSFCAMCGYEQYELKGRKAEEFLFNYDAKLPENAETKNENPQINDSYIISVVAKDGQRKWWLVSEAEQYDSQGNLKGFIGIHLDITKRIQTEKELILAKQYVEKSSRVRDLFLANVSHEIRTPLNAVIGISKQLQRTSLDALQQKYVDVIGTAANNLLTIINNILDFSKIEAREVKLQSTGFQLQRVIQDVTTIMRQRAEEKGLLMNVSVSRVLPEILIGDSFHISQVILNLLSNAIKFTPKGTVELNCRSTREVNNTSHVCIEINDTGVGMEKAFLSNVFDKFTTEDHSSTQLSNGTGLGMSISKELVELMGGRLEVESEKEKGTRINVHLWLHIGTKADLPVISHLKADLSQLPGKKILVVEDNEMNQMVAETLLSYHGMNIVLANNGKDALNIVAGNSFDLVLMDMKMPVMDGLEATIKLREMGYMVPIIALTANALKGEDEKCLDAGMNDFITKPFEEEVFLAKVAYWISQKSDENVPPVFDATVGENLTEARTDGVFSLATLAQISQDNIEFLQAMVDIFAKDAAGTIEGFKQALAKKDGHTIHELAHRIKPSISNFCIPFVEEIKRMDALGHMGVVDDEMEQLVKKFETLINQVIIGLMHWSESNKV